MSNNEWTYEEPKLKGQRFSIQQGSWMAVYEDGTDKVISKAAAVEYKNGGIPDLTPMSIYQKSMIPSMLDIYF